MDGRYLLLGGALAGALLLCAIIFVFVRYRRGLARRTKTRRARTLRHPVVLAHGVMGFDKLEVAGARAEYFRGISERLRELGAEVYPVRVSPSEGVAVRARQLADAVKAIDAKRVNIIAHSMGGLDARYAISQLGLAAKVVSLTTVGTPHRGTPLADFGTSLGTKLGLKRLVSALGIPIDAFYDLTTERMAAFNQQVTDHPKVHYASFVGAVQERIPGLNPLLLPAHLFLSEKAGPNDGLVPHSSQRWGEVLGTIDADHWAQIGWSLRFDAPGFYVNVVDQLRDRGL